MATIPTGFKALPLPIIQLSLAAVLKCGQSFRWSIFPLSSNPPPPSGTQPTHEYRLCLRDRVVCLRQSPTTLFYRAIFPDPQPTSTQQPLRDAETLAWLNDYFQLDVDLTKLYEEWAARDKVFAKFQGRFSGIRILRQDPWENLVSFICSSNNNISRITKMVHSLCQHYSPPLLSLPSPSAFVDDPEKTYHPFPPPSVLAAPEVSAKLRLMGFGYRADFIQRTAKMLTDTHGLSTQPTSEPSEKWLMGLRKVGTAEAREELLKFVGVGRKVADCVLLMSLDKKEVVPVDTHVHQIAIKHYGLKGSTSGKTNMTPKLYDEVNAKLFGVWGEYAGWAHSVLFTADLKSFSSYNLAAPSESLSSSPATSNHSSPASANSRKRGNTSKKSGITHGTPLNPSPTPLKRKSSAREIGESDLGTAMPDVKAVGGETETALGALADNMSLAERVKKRQRGVGQGAGGITVRA